MLKREVKFNGRVTIVVPTFNREKYIKECLESIVSQTYKDIKIVVVDDASTDSTLSIVSEFLLKDKRVDLVIHDENSGSQSKAFHDSILNCDTEYWTWIGSDDLYLTTTAIESLVNYHKKHPNADYISCNLSMFEEGKEVCKLCHSSFPSANGYVSLDPFQEFDKKTYVTTIYKYLCPPFPWNGMFKNSFFIKNDITWEDHYCNKWSPDTINGLYFYSKGLRSKHLNMNLIKYRKHDGQDTVKGLVKDQIKADVKLIQAIYDWFETDIFTDSRLNKLDKVRSQIDRLKILIESRYQQHKESEHISEALSYVSGYALRLLWNSRSSMTEEEYIDYRAYFGNFIN